MTLFMSVLMVLLACVCYAIVAKIAINAVVDLYVSGNDVLWIVGYTVLGTICLRVGLLLLSGAYPHD